MKRLLPTTKLLLFKTAEVRFSPDRHWAGFPVEICWQACSRVAFIKGRRTCLKTKIVIVIRCIDAIKLGRLVINYFGRCYILRWSLNFPEYVIKIYAEGSIAIFCNYNFIIYYTVFTPENAIAE